MLRQLSSRNDNFGSTYIVIWNEHHFKQIFGDLVIVYHV